jgi:hypothetical protein
MTIFWFFFGMLLLAILIALIRYYTVKTCESCSYPLHKCECPGKCDHAETFPRRWSQDGWVTRCKVCGDTLYLGDIYDDDV